MSCTVRNYITEDNVVLGEIHYELRIGIRAEYLLSSWINFAKSKAAHLAANGNVPYPACTRSKIRSNVCR